MERTVLHDLGELRQSIWLDNISRSLISSGRLNALIEKGVMGLTSNPTIFDISISKSADYDALIGELAKSGRTVLEIYDDLTVRDVRDAAGAFLPVYERTEGVDGFVSLEVNPRLALKTKETIDDCRRLHKKVAMPNVMFKIPATKEGIAAIETLISEGININATLIFSLNQYVRTAEAYVKGLNSFARRKGDLKTVASVASVFVSRIDSAADKALREIPAKGMNPAKKDMIEKLMGKAAVANTHIIYSRYVQIFSSGAFRKLMNFGARPQRALWASTGTKDLSYSDVKYITELIGKGTVNTVPDKTLEAFIDHGAAKEALTGDATAAKHVIHQFARVGIDVDGICKKLLQDGLGAFEKSFESLLAAIESKSRSVNTPQ